LVDVCTDDPKVFPEDRKKHLSASWPSRSTNWGCGTRRRISAARRSARCPPG
jgi:hypothetical protein